MSRVEVLSGPERRRRWSAEQKRSIVAEAFAPGASVCEVARRRDVVAGQIYRWRNELRTAAEGFTEVVVAAEQSEGQCEETQIAVRLLHERNRKSRRFRSFIIIFVGLEDLTAATLRCRHCNRQRQSSDS